MPDESSPLMERRSVRRESDPRPGPHRALAWGLAIGAAYVGVVALSWSPTVRLLYDGLVPLPPYRWVTPPPERAKDNQPPQPGADTLALGPRGSPAAEVATGDDQALATFPAAALAPRPGESSVKVRLSPLDPLTLGTVPAGRRFDGNAYRIEATYAASAAPAVLTAPVTVVLRYPAHATLLLRAQDAGWQSLHTTRFDGSQQVLGPSNDLGVFVAASPSISRSAATTRAVCTRNDGSHRRPRTGAGAR